MKRLIIAISLIVSAACAGTPLEDAVKVGDWTNAARLVTYRDTGPINAGNVRQIYAAAKQLKLDQKTAIAAYKALSLGDTELFQGFLNTVEVKYNENAGGWPSFSPNAYSWIFTNKQDSASWRKSENGKYVEVNLNEQFPEMMLAFYQKRAAAGDYMAVLHAAWHATNYGALELAPHMTGDWRKALDVITPEILDTCPDIFLIRHFLNYVKASKGLAVRDTFITSRFMQLNALKSKVINPFSNKKKPEILEAYIQYSPILGIRIQAARQLDGIRHNKEATLGLWSYVTQNGSWKDKAELAVYIGDRDRIIDTFTSIDETATPELLDSMIVALNKLDREYRKADVLSILNNVNSKYTLKLYDDAKTWEPVISKVRAMIEVRED